MDNNTRTGRNDIDPPYNQGSGSGSGSFWTDPENFHQIRIGTSQIQVNFSIVSSKINIKVSEEI